MMKSSTDETARNAKRVIYHGFSDQNRCLIVDRLHEKYNWTPIMMLGLDGESDHIKIWADRFTNLVLLDTMKLRTSDFDYSYIGEYTPIDRVIIDKLSRYESSYIDNLDDVTGWAFSFTERREFYHKMLRYMNSVLHNFDPDLVVFATWPHTPTCLALYYLCKHHLNVDVIFLDAMPLFGGRYSSVGNTLEKLYVPFMDIYESDDAVPLGADVSSYLKDLRSVKGRTTDHIKEDYSDDKRVPLSLLKKLCLLPIRLLLNKVSDHEKLIEWKKNKRRFSLKSSRLGIFQILFFKLGLIIKNKILYRSYKALCTEANLDQKFIYLAANYQPEATTLPTAGPFEDMSLVVDMVSKCAPEGWVIYFKEHPFTFANRSLSTLSKRSEFIYKTIASYPNVKLLLPQEDGFQLISQSQVVVSIGGTSAWEAAVRGIPSICFGSVWYKGCKSIFSVDTLKDMQNALADIKNGYKPDARDVDRYAASVAQCAVKGMISDRFEKNLGLSDDKDNNINTIAGAIYDGHNKLNGSN